MKTEEAKKVEMADRKGVTAARIIVTALGIGIMTGATIALGIHGVVKKMFVNEKWPGEEWSNDDWAEEDLEN